MIQIPHLLFGFFSLLQPWLLLFAFGALLPLLIHYLNRNSHRKVRWAAMEYLTLALNKVAKRFSILQLLLLLLRILVVLLLTACLAAPILTERAGGQAVSNESSVLKVVVIDQSFSMQAVQDDVSRFDQARRTAIDLVEHGNAGDGFALFTFDSNLVPVLSKPTSNSETTRKTIEVLSAGSRSTQPKKILPELIEFCQSKESENYDEVEIHFISDFISKDWEFTEATETSPDWNELQSMSKLHLHRIGSKPLSNNSVTQLSFERSISIIDQNNPVSVEIQNHGASMAQEVLVELLVNDRVIESKPLDVPANGSSSVPFDLVLNKQGTHRIAARIGGDGLTLDNYRYETIHVRDKYRIGFLEGKPGSSKFLQLAISPAAKSNSPFDMTVFRVNQFQSFDPKRFDLLFVDNIRELPEFQIQRILNYVHSGHSVYLFLGDQLNRAAFNKHWNSGDQPSLGLRILGRQPLDHYTIDPLEFKSPFLRAFRGNQGSGLSSLPIWTYYKLEMDSEIPRVDLAFANGDPLLVSTSVGKGVLSVFTSSSSSLSKVPGVSNVSWNALETSPAFPALIQEFFQRSVEKTPNEGLFVGHAGFGESEEQSRVEDLVLEGPDGISTDIVFQQKNGRISWTMDAFRQPGFYTLTTRKTNEVDLQILAVNVDAKESNIHEALKIEGQFSGGLDSRRAPESYFSIQLFQFLLGALAVLLIIESCIGFRFGKQNA